jgi:hypothetical protein
MLGKEAQFINGTWAEKHNPDRGAVWSEFQKDTVACGHHIDRVHKMIAECRNSLPPSINSVSMLRSCNAMSI